MPAVAVVALTATPLITLPSSAPTAARKGAGTVVVSGGTLVDGTGSEPLAGATIVVRDGRVAEVTAGDTLGSGFHPVYNVTGTVGAVDPNYGSGLLSGWDPSINLERSDLTRRPGSLWFEASRPGTGRGDRQRSGSFASDHIQRDARGQRLATLLHWL